MKIFILTVLTILIMYPMMARAVATTTAPSSVKLENPISDITVTALIGRIIKTALGVMGGLTLLMVVWGGVTWINAAGNAEKITAGKNIIIWALLGAILTVSSYVILNTIFTYYLSPQ